MKIAVIGSRGYPYVYSGYETFVKELSERLIEQNISVTVYCHKNLFKKYPKVVNGINLVYLPTIEKKSLSQFLHSFQSILHACFSNYDIILVVNSSNGPFGLITRLFRKKTIINVDGLEWLRPKWKGLGAKYFYFASKLAVKLFDLIITDSTEMQKIYLKEFGAASQMIVYGANIRYSQKPELIKKWNLKNDNYYLIVGRLIPDNNADILVNEFVNSSSKKKLVIVGDVPYQDKYTQKIKLINDPRVVFTGYINDQDELAELYHNCFVYLHGHEFGGTNPTMLKALAYGCAIFALDTVFNREMLDNGKYGYFFSKKGATLTELLNKNEACSENIYKLREIGRERICNYYTWDKITKEYISVFWGLLSPDETTERSVTHRLGL